MPSKFEVAHQFGIQISNPSISLVERDSTETIHFCATLKVGTSSNKAGRSFCKNRGTVARLPVRSNEQATRNLFSFKLLITQVLAAHKYAYKNHA